MKCDNKKVLAMSYMLLESLTRKELLKVIMLLIGEYLREYKAEPEVENVKDKI